MISLKVIFKKLFLLSFIFLCFSCKKRPEKITQAPSIETESEFLGDDYSVFYGVWHVESEIVIPGIIFSMGDYDVLDKYISYSDDGIKYEGQLYKIESIKKEQWTSEDLFKETAGTGSKGITFKDFNIQAYSVTVYHLKFTDKGRKTIFVIDDNHLILANGSLYFNLVK